MEWLGILEEKKVALLEDLTEGNSKKMWAEAMSMTYDMGNICVTTAKEGDMSPFKKRNGILLPPAVVSLSLRLGTWGRVAFGALWWGWLTMIEVALSGCATLRQARLFAVKMYRAAEKSEKRKQGYERRRK